MATWNSRGLRGSTLEDLINRTNEHYLAHGLALMFAAITLSNLPQRKQTGKRETQ